MVWTRIAKDRIFENSEGFFLQWKSLEVASIGQEKNPRQGCLSACTSGGS